MSSPEENADPAGRETTDAGGAAPGVVPGPTVFDVEGAEQEDGSSRDCTVDGGDAVAQNTGADSFTVEEDWSGEPLQAYQVGDPGRAALEVVPAVASNPQDPTDTALDEGTVGALTLRAASRRGTSHRHAGTPRQDDYAVCSVSDRWLVVAVADGVSAGALSHQAATIASRTGAGLIRDALEHEADPGDLDWKSMLDAIAKRIVAHGQRALSEGRDEAVTVEPAEVARAMATTLVMAVVDAHAGDDGAHGGVLMSVGDTSAFHLAGDGRWQPITSVKNEGAAIASSAVAALPYLPATPPTPVPLALRAGESVFVMTDGVGDPLGMGDGAVGRFLSKVWQAPPDILSFGGQMAFARRSFDDDRTVVGVWAT